MPDGVVLGALHRMRVRWLAKGGWLVCDPFRLRGLAYEPHLQSVRQKSVLGD
jgi:hypothetical protein